MKKSYTPIRRKKWVICRKLKTGEILCVNSTDSSLAFSIEKVTIFYSYQSVVSYFSYVKRIYPDDDTFIARINSKTCPVKLTHDGTWYGFLGNRYSTDSYKVI